MCLSRNLFKLEITFLTFPFPSLRFLAPKMFFFPIFGTTGSSVRLECQPIFNRQFRDYCTLRDSFLVSAVKAPVLSVSYCTVQEQTLGRQRRRFCDETWNHQNTAQFRRLRAVRVSCYFQANDSTLEKCKITHIYMYTIYLLYIYLEYSTCKCTSLIIVTVKLTDLTSKIISKKRRYSNDTNRMMK